MPEIETSAVHNSGETTVTADVWEEGAVSLMVENSTTTFILVLDSLASFSGFENFVRTSRILEPCSREIEGTNGVVVIWRRQDARLTFSILGNSGLGVQSHQISIYFYGPRLTEFLDCLAEVHEELMALDGPTSDGPDRE